LPSFLSRIAPVYLRLSGANRIYTSTAAAQRHLRKSAARRPWLRPPPWVVEATRVEVDVVADMPVVTLRPRKGEPRGSVVYVHGGAWVNEIAPQHWLLIAQIANDANTTVIVPIYPLVPHGTAEQVVSAVVDLARRALAEHGGVCLVGDSAGGQIALSAALVLLSRHDIRLPRTILIAPALDLSMKNPEMDAVQPSDPWLAKPGTRVYIDAWRADLAIDDPRVSPLEGELAGLGPLTVFSGTRDILNPDARLLVEKARAAGVTVDYREGDGLVHVYPLTPTVEGRMARKLIVAQVTVR
jgi:acetyl esterase/lipase